MPTVELIGFLTKCLNFNCNQQTITMEAWNFWFFLANAGTLQTITSQDLPAGVFRGQRKLKTLYVFLTPDDGILLLFKFPKQIQQHSFFHFELLSPNLKNNRVKYYGNFLFGICHSCIAPHLHALTWMLASGNNTLKPGAPLQVFCGKVWFEGEDSRSKSKSEHAHCQMDRNNVIASTEALAILCVMCVRWERERERETDRQTEREREREKRQTDRLDRRKWHHHWRAEIGDEFTLSLAETSHFSFFLSHFPPLPS